MRRRRRRRRRCNVGGEHVLNTTPAREGAERVGEESAEEHVRRHVQLHRPCDELVERHHAPRDAPDTGAERLGHPRPHTRRQRRPLGMLRRFLIFCLAFAKHVERLHGAHEVFAPFGDVHLRVRLRRRLGPGRCCSPRHSTHSTPSCPALNGIL
jgi:hypothetical protein